MKKFYTLTLLFLGFVSAVAQTVVYSENFGTPSGTTAIANHTFQNTSITYTGTADVRPTQASSGYTGASGSGNVFFTGTAGRYLTIEGINTSAYPTAELSLNFGIRQEGNTPAVPASNLSVEYSVDGLIYLPLSYSRTVNSNWENITINSGIPSALNLRLRFTQTATTQYRLDDVKILANSATCLLSLGTETAQCDNVTTGIDTFTITIPFTGGGLSAYNITSTHGTIGGANPSTTASGNIVITGINENIGTNITVTVTGGTCNITREVTRVTCKAINTLPYSESFDYQAGTVLGNQQKWTEVNSGDRPVMLPGSLNYTGVTSTGNSVGFGGAGAEVYTPFTSTTSGTIYTAFLMNVADMSNLTTDGTQSYIVGLTGEIEGTNVPYNARLWVQKSGTQYKIGLSSAATTTNYTTTSYNEGDVVMVVIGFNYANNTYSAWINPNLATFNASTAPTLTDVVTTAPANFGAVILRQDSDTVTPANIIVDELRITTDLSTLSRQSNDIAGFAMFPNPVNGGGLLSITSDNTSDKEVAIYDVMGKQVLNSLTTNNTVNISNLTSGIYLVKVTEEGKTATRKLVVR